MMYTSFALGHVVTQELMDDDVYSRPRWVQMELFDLEEILDWSFLDNEDDEWDDE